MCMWVGVCVWCAPRACSTKGRTGLAAMRTRCHDVAACSLRRVRLLRGQGTAPVGRQRGRQGERRARLDLAAVLPTRRLPVFWVCVCQWRVRGAGVSDSLPGQGSARTRAWVVGGGWGGVFWCSRPAAACQNRRGGVSMVRWRNNGHGSSGWPVQDMSVCAQAAGIQGRGMGVTRAVLQQAGPQRHRSCKGGRG
jgi:hypothetical protein